MGKNQKPNRNWAQYNESLVERGSIFFWFSQDINVFDLSECNKNKHGRPFKFSHEFIYMALIVKNLYHLTYRGTHGFLRSILPLLGVDRQIPHWTSLCARARSLHKSLPKIIKTSQKNQLIHIAFDSTGLKVFGEGEWKRFVHGKGARRQWRKLHIGIDTETQEIVAQEISTSQTHDSQEFENLLEQVTTPLGCVFADGAYDQKRCYHMVQEKGGQSIFQIRKNARLWKNDEGHLINCDRNENLLNIQKFGEKQWKKQTNYHKRSLVEGTFSRYKRLFGERMFSREFQRQITETQVKCALLNKMTQKSKTEQLVGA